MTETEMRFALLTVLIRMNSSQSKTTEELTREAIIAVSSIEGDELDDN